jgi:SM-20-related protein
MSQHDAMAPPDDVPLELNPLLTAETFSDDFRRQGRIHISGLLTDAAAQRLFRALHKETPWGLIYNDGEKAHEFKHSTVSAEDHQEKAIAAWERAHSRFQYFYHVCRLLENRKIHPGPRHYLVRLVKFLTSREFLSFIRTVTGDDSIGWVSANATLYKPLDFLTAHDDGLSERRIAYVLNMTPEWKPDWGGALQFYDHDDHIEEGYLPTFNSLNLFRVPKRHSVAQVSTFGGMRYSISGWFQPALATPE